MKLEGIHHVTAITATRPGTSISTRGCSACGSSRRASTRTTRPSTTCSTATSEARREWTSRSSNIPARARGKAGAGMVHRIVWRVASEDALAFWEERLAAESVGPSVSSGSLVFADPEGLGHELVVVGDDRRAADRRPSGDPEGGRAAGLRRRACIHVRPGAEPPVPRADARVLAGRRGRLGGTGRRARLVLPLRPDRASAASPAPAPSTTSPGPR